jgi:intracellular sulfur oxidation DsrE/DsrF family protein
MNKSQVRSGVAVIFMLLFVATGAWGQELNDSAALSGLTEGKGIFVLSSNDPETAADYLGVIKFTHQSMKEQKVQPDFIVVVIGPAVRFMTTEPSVELNGNKSALDAIATSVRELAKIGVKMEICAFATDYFKVPNDKLLPELKLVGDGWISLIGYQNKGYGFVPSF